MDSSLTTTNKKDNYDGNKSAASKAALVHGHNSDGKPVWNQQTLRWLKYIIVVSFFTRFVLIQWPPQVVFDEHHHIKFISWYVKREYYLDVHPPLGRLIFAGVAELFGYNGQYDPDKPNSTFTDSTFPLVAVRSVSASLSVLTSALIYSILIEMKFSLAASILGAAMVVFDNSLTIVGRIFVLESQLIAYMVLTCFCWVKFRLYHKEPFTSRWWLWLFSTGLGIGLSLGVKYVGLFIMLIIGVCTLLDLWDVCNVKKTRSNLVVLYHWLARAVCLIGVPLVIFVFSYWVHLQVAYKSGNGDDSMSAEFQSTLQGNKITNEILPVYYGSMVRFKSKVENIYLHSHIHKYPQVFNNKVSSNGQQVTGYGHKDDNNLWQIIPADLKFIENKGDYNEDRFLIRNGDLVRLMHNTTQKYLLTHNVASPLTMTNQEVTAVDWDGTEEHEKAEKTIWRVDLIESIADPRFDNKYLTTKIHYIRLTHIDTNCTLLNFEVSLPEWGYKQREINAAKVDTPNTLWSVDTVIPPNGWTSFELENARGVDYLGHKKPTFWKKFVEVVLVSLETNSKLVDPHSSLWDPLMWPFMTKGMNFYFCKDPNNDEENSNEIKNEDKNKCRIYLLGNPFTWYLGLLSLPMLLLIIVVDRFAELRGYQLLTRQQRSFLYPKGCFFLLAYLTHYLPFFFMGRILYFHHYLPSYLLSTLVFACVYQVAVLRFPTLGSRNTIAAICVIAIAMFWRFSPLTYGLDITEEGLKSLQWTKGWHFI